MRKRRRRRRRRSRRRNIRTIIMALEQVTVRNISKSLRSYL